MGIHVCRLKRFFESFKGILLLWVKFTNTLTKTFLKKLMMKLKQQTDQERKVKQYWLEFGLWNQTKSIDSCYYCNQILSQQDLEPRLKLPETSKWPINKRTVSFCLHFYWPIRDCHLPRLPERNFDSFWNVSKERYEINNIFLRSESIDLKVVLIFLISCTLFPRPTPNVELPEIRKPCSLS